MEITHTTREAQSTILSFCEQPRHWASTEEIADVKNWIEAEAKWMGATLPETGAYALEMGIKKHENNFGFLIKLNYAIKQALTELKQNRFRSE